MLDNGGKISHRGLHNHDPHDALAAVYDPDSLRDDDQNDLVVSALEDAHAAMDHARVLEQVQAAMGHGHAMDHGHLDDPHGLVDDDVDGVGAMVHHHHMSLAGLAGTDDDLAAAEAQLHHLLPLELHPDDPNAHLHLAGIMQQALQVVEQQQHAALEHGLHGLTQEDLAAQHAALLEQAMALAALTPLGDPLPGLDAHGQPTYPQMPDAGAAAAAAAAAAAVAAAAAASVPQATLQAQLGMQPSGPASGRKGERRRKGDGPDSGDRGQDRRVRKRSEKKRKRAERELQEAAVPDDEDDDDPFGDGNFAAIAAAAKMARQHAAQAQAVAAAAVAAAAATAASGAALGLAPAHAHAHAQQHHAGAHMPGGGDATGAAGMDDGYRNHALVAALLAAAGTHPAGAAAVYQAAASYGALPVAPSLPGAPPAVPGIDPETLSAAAAQLTLPLGLYAGAGNGQGVAGMDGAGAYGADPGASGLEGMQQQGGHAAMAAGEAMQLPAAHTMHAHQTEAAAAAVAAAVAAAAAQPLGGVGGPLLESYNDSRPLRGGPKRMTQMSWNEDLKRTDVKSGPFSQQESETAKAAARQYALAHGKSCTDWSWMFSLQREGMHGMITMISEAVPHRTRKSLWAHLTRVLHAGNYKGHFNEEEDRLLLELVERHGRKWKTIGQELGRLPEQCRDRWRHIGINQQRTTGPWSVDEMTRLQEVVREHMDAKQRAEGATDTALAAAARADALGNPVFAAPKALRPGASRRIVLDGINWEAVAARMGSRNPQQCKEKWYDALCPSMVSRGDWGAGDDKRMLRSLLLSGAAREWEVQWGCLVEGRTEQQTKRRWRLMLKCVPDHRNMEFDQVLTFLVDKYAPKLRSLAGGGLAGGEGADAAQQHALEALDAAGQAQQAADMLGQEQAQQAAMMTQQMMQLQGLDPLQGLGSADAAAGLLDPGMQQRRQQAAAAAAAVAAAAAAAAAMGPAGPGMLPGMGPPAAHHPVHMLPAAHAHGALAQDMLAAAAAAAAAMTAAAATAAGGVRPVH